jgi:hypothetical protein
MPSSKKPKEYGDFEELTKKLLAVPKKELDKKVATYNAKKAAKKDRPEK